MPTENKTKSTKLSVAEFVEAVPDATKRADAKTLIKMMRKVSGETPKMWGPSIIGFGCYHYKYETGREGDMPVVGFSPRKAATVLYGLNGSTTESLIAKLGKHSGTGCIYVKKLADIDLAVLERMIEAAVKTARAK